VGASRENLNLFRMIFNKEFKRAKDTVKRAIKYKWVRVNLIDDTFNIPFNKKIGCRMFGHKWATKQEIEIYDIGSEYCWKCSKKMTLSEKRDMLISSILD
jgi:hypothetical protein